MERVFGKKVQTKWLPFPYLLIAVAMTFLPLLSLNNTTRTCLFVCVWIPVIEWVHGEEDTQHNSYNSTYLKHCRKNLQTYFVINVSIKIQNILVFSFFRSTETTARIHTWLELGYYYFILKYQDCVKRWWVRPCICFYIFCNLGQYILNENEIV